MVKGRTVRCYITLHCTTDWTMQSMGVRMSSEVDNCSVAGVLEEERDG
jgi:hypothetical protein